MEMSEGGKRLASLQRGLNISAKLSISVPRWRTRTWRSACCAVSPRATRNVVLNFGDEQRGTAIARRREGAHERGISSGKAEDGNGDVKTVKNGERGQAFNTDRESRSQSYCGKVGHMIDKCWTKQKDENRGPRRGGNDQWQRPWTRANNIQWRNDSDGYDYTTTIE
ncbi:hypothetical protein Pcac1_g29433 [Phytophthora cactorum]|nr:hypothetical protein Pcac1_g29433 [Phytophthora cactorum]